MLFDRIRQAAQVVERLSGADSHVVVAVNTGGKGRVTAVSTASTPRQGGDMENDEERTEHAELDADELKGVEGEALPERTQMSVLRMPGHTLPVVPFPPEVE
jgi:hypothetical protein